MHEIRMSGLWNNPQKVLQSRGAIYRVTPDRNLSQPATLPSLPKESRGVPTGVYIAGGILTAAIIGIVAL